MDYGGVGYASDIWLWLEGQGNSTVQGKSAPVGSGAPNSNDSLQNAVKLLKGLFKR
jgi:hypothetical protein